jgi:hypothetical protein
MDGETLIVLLAGKPLLLSRRHDIAIQDDGCG